MGLKFRDGTAYYYQIKEDLTRRIANGEFGIHQRLPAEMTLVNEYGVSRPTIRQAILELVQSGLLVRTRGKGTFVLPAMIVSEAHAFRSFAEEMRQKGIEPSARLLSVRELKAPMLVAHDLEIDEGDKVFEITRLRLGNGTPLVVRTLQIPVALAPDLLAKPVHSEPIYEILRREYGIIVSGSIQHFAAAAASEDLADHLDVKVGASVLLWYGVTVDLAQRPIARTRAYYRGDRFEFTVRQGNLRIDTSPDISIKGTSLAERQDMDDHA